MKKLFLFLFAYGFSLIACSAQGTWVQKANLPGMARSSAAGFSIGTKGYIGTGYINSTPWGTSDFWEYDRTTNVWTQKANFAGTARCYAIGFSIGNKGYIGTGVDTTTFNLNDLWEWDQSTNIWTQKANLPGQGRNCAIGFSIGSKGYITTGAYDVTISSQNFLTDLWEYDSPTDTWTQKANFPGIKRQFATGFSIANKGYVGTGNDTTNNQNGFDKDFWEWDQATNTWAQKADFPGGKRCGAYGYSIGNYGYVGMGSDTSFQITINDLWRYFPFTNTWTQVASFPGGTRAFPVGFSIGCQGFFGTGADTAWNYYSDFWEYFPDTLTAAVSGSPVICSNDSATLYAFGGISFSWSTGETTQFITVYPSVTTSYTVDVSDVCGSANTVATVTVHQSPAASTSYQPDLCGSGSVQFIDNITNSTSWIWNFGDGDTSSAQNPVHIYSASGSYSVTLSMTGYLGCNTVNQLVVVVPPFSQLYIPNAFSPNDDGRDDIYYVFGKCITEMTFTVYDRWGEKVFETNDPTVGWDGRYKGQMENTGVFMYSFNGTLTTGEKVNQKGNITLMR